MKSRQVLFAPEAVGDLEALYDLIAGRAGVDRALGYLSRLEAYCHGFDLASERGSARDDIRPGLRIASFERRVTLAFQVTETQVVFLRIFYAGVDWRAAFQEE